MSYIDRELLLIGVDGCISALHVQAKGDLVQEGAIKLVEATRDYIASLSAADVAPVRHGRWLDEDFPDKPATVHGMAIFSVCGELSHKAEHGYNILSIYCPNCGAKMDKEAADEI